VVDTFGNGIIINISIETKEVELIQKLNQKRLQLILEVHKMNADELEQVIQAVKQRRSALHSIATSSFRRGDTVQFSGKYGRTVSGTVEKIAQKYVTINCGTDGRWRVPAGHIQAVA
jgi:hypothetical protein